MPPASAERGTRRQSAGRDDERASASAADVRLRPPWPGSLAALKRSPLFRFGPTGLAVGLAPKERRYGLIARFAPGEGLRPLLRFPRSPAGGATGDSAGLMAAAVYPRQPDH